MDFRSLRYFVAVYEELSLSAASKRCFVAQPSISASIQQLESELDTSLFVRHSKGVTPTPRGTQLYLSACRVLKDVQAIKQAFLEQPEHRPLCLGLMPFLSGKRVSHIIQALIRDVPGLDLTLVDSAESSDARIISNSILEPGEAFHKLWTDHYVLALPKDHPLTEYTQVDISHLNHLPFVSRRPCDLTDAWEHAIQKKGINLNIKATVRTEEYALDLVAAGLGVSVVPRHSTDSREDIETREVSGLLLQRVVVLAYQQDKPLPAELLTAIDSVRSEFSDDLPELSAAG